MRCVAGVILFLVLYFGSCTLLGGIVLKLSGPAAKAEALRKYHAPLAVAAGAASIFACCLPTILARASRREFERMEAEWNQ